MKKGFTLIELLAVIVILAIIALIATPIVLNIISNSKKSANERSIELYGKAVEHTIADYMMVNPSSTPTWSDIENSISEYYTGNPITSSAIVYTDGTIYLYNFSINGEQIDGDYGKFKTYYKCENNCSRGDKVRLLDDSQYYVYQNNDNNIKLLSTTRQNISTIEDKLIELKQNKLVNDSTTIESFNETIAMDILEVSGPSIPAPFSKEDWRYEYFYLFFPILQLPNESNYEQVGTPAVSWCAPNAVHLSSTSPQVDPNTVYVLTIEK